MGRIAIARHALKHGARQALNDANRSLLLRGFERDFDAVWTRVDAVPGWLNPVSAAALFRVIEATRPGNVVEIGSYLGRSTVLFALSCRELGIPAHVTAIDPHTGDRQHLEALGAETLGTFGLFQRFCEVSGVTDIVEPIVAPSSVAAETWKQPIDFLYVDGWHSYDAVMEDGVTWLPFLRDNGVVVFDDYLSYDEVGRAIDDLDRKGAFHLWCPFFGQAIGGKAPEPPEPLRPLIEFARGRVRRWR